MWLALIDDPLSLSACFDKYCEHYPDPVTVMIDEADAILDFKGWEELIRNLVHVSVDDKKFNVMLCCSQPDNVKKILELNGRTKIKLIGGIVTHYARWTKEEIDMYIVGKSTD